MRGVVIDGNMIRGGCAVLRFHVNMCCGQLTAKLRVEKNCIMFTGRRADDENLAKFLANHFQIAKLCRQHTYL